MNDWILVDELHVGVSVRRVWPVQRQDAAVRALQQRWFRRKLDLAVRRLIRRHPALLGVNVSMSR